MWARALGRLAGVQVPLVAMHHAYVVTERIEGIQVSPARLQPGSSALGDRAGEAETPLPLPGTPPDLWELLIAARSGSVLRGVHTLGRAVRSP